MDFFAGGEGLCPPKEQISYFTCKRGSVSLKPVPVQEQEEPALSTILQTAATLVPSST